MANDDSFARRFIAGETVEEAIALRAQRCRRAACSSRSTTSARASARSRRPTAATREYLRLIDVIVASGIERNISLKLTQLGHRRRPRDLRRQPAPHPRARRTRHGFFVRIDMEDSAYTEVTLEVFETLWQQGYRNIGVALQAYLHRTRDRTCGG